MLSHPIPRGFPVPGSVNLPTGNTVTRQLKKAIEDGEVSRSLFSAEQMQAIEAEAPTIPGYTWHHHQGRGRMQLVPKDIHKETGHVGGMNLWFEEEP
jgi:hypothetical protein